MKLKNWISSQDKLKRIKLSIFYFLTNAANQLFQFLINIIQALQMNQFFLSENHLLDFSIDQNQTGFLITLIDFRDEENLHKMQIKLMKAENEDINIFSLFSGVRQLSVFFKQNSVIDLDSKCIKIQFIVLGGNFEKKVTKIFQFQEVELSVTDSLKLLSKILRMQIDEKKKEMERNQIQNNPQAKFDKKINSGLYFDIHLEQEAKMIDTERQQLKQEIPVKRAQQSHGKIVLDLSSQQSAQMEQKLHRNKTDKKKRIQKRKIKRIRKIKEQAKSKQLSISKPLDLKLQTKNILPEKQEHKKKYYAIKTTADQTELIKQLTYKQQPKPKVLQKNFSRQSFMEKVFDSKKGQKIKINYQNGDHYYGQFKDGDYNGFGFYSSKVHGTYQGEWKNGKANGYGVAIDEFGNRMEGYWVNDKRQGKGIDLYANGEKYEGQYLNNKKSGFGQYRYADGTIFKGNWRNQKCQGPGVQFYPDGSYFKGGWRDDEKDGLGILTKNKKIVRQYWKMGILKKQQLQKI